VDFRNGKIIGRTVGKELKTDERNKENLDVN
jgi:hypothetical protein